jgi:hypothetical protein
MRRICASAPIGQGRRVPFHFAFLASPAVKAPERRDNLTVSVPDEIEIRDYADEDTPPFPVPWMKGDLAASGAVRITIIERDSVCSSVCSLGHGPETRR